VHERLYLAAYAVHTGNCGSSHGAADSPGGLATLDALQLIAGGDPMVTQIMEPPALNLKTLSVTRAAKVTQGPQ
jgi:hypothetical protein